MDIFATFATDEAAEEAGVVHFLVAGKTDPAVDPWIKVARIGNTAYNKKIAKTYEALQVQKKAERLSSDEMEIRSKNGMIEAYAETVLMGFGNLEFQGKALPPGKESHMTFLRVKDFLELVANKAAEVEHYRLQDREAAAGN